MSFSMIAATLVCVICISIGQLLFKQAAVALPPEPQMLDWIFNGWLIASLALYGMTTLGWVWILRHVPLHLAYPFMGLAFLIVPALSWLLLNEPVHWKTMLGGALILVGVALAASSG